MDNNGIKSIVESGLKKANHSKLMQAYSFITGKPMKSNCGECAKRSAIKTIMTYYNQIQNGTN